MGTLKGHGMDNFRQHLSERRLNQELGIVDWYDEVVTFPLWNLSGQMLGYQQYRWNMPKKGNKPYLNKYFTYLPRGSIAVFGLEHIPEGYIGDIKVVEGIWKSVALRSVGEVSIAVLGNNPKQLKNWLNSMPWNVIPLCQPDKAGRKLANLNKANAVFFDKDIDDIIKDGEWK